MEQLPRPSKRKEPARRCGNRHSIKFSDSESLFASHQFREGRKSVPTLLGKHSSDFAIANRSYAGLFRPTGGSVLSRMPRRVPELVNGLAR